MMKAILLSVALMLWHCADESFALGVHNVRNTRSTLTQTLPSSLRLAGSRDEAMTTSKPLPVKMIMDDVLKGNGTVASVAVNMLMEVRGTDKMEEYLGDMLPPERLPIWTRLPLSAKFSRRARQYQLSRLLELSTPTTSSDEEESSIKDDEDSEKRRLRRALFILLRSMAENPDFKGISDMLSMAKKDAKSGNMSSKEMLNRTPDNLETPNYQVLFANEAQGFQVRRYEQYSVCSVKMGELKPSGSDSESAKKLSNPQLSGATSFGALAGYLFGKNEEQKAMKMTTPVFTQGEGTSRTMSFVLPSDYWENDGLLNAPKPLPDSSVKVSSVDTCERAVLAFGGFGRKADVKKRSKRLTELLESNREWQRVQDSQVILAQYNDPFTPPWKRRNEVSILVEPRQ